MAFFLAHVGSFVAVFGPALVVLVAGFTVLARSPG
jgi:hypothetical protein